MISDLHLFYAVSNMKDEVEGGKDSSQPCSVPDARDDGLGLEVVAEAVGALLPSDAAHLVPAERDGRVEHVVAVHPHRARPQRPRHRVRRVQAPREHPRRQPVRRRVRAPDHLLQASAQKQQEKKVCVMRPRHSGVEFTQLKIILVLEMRVLELEDSLDRPEYFLLGDLHFVLR
jgi:hypothetical protein